jgi:hypothetical protein
LVEEGGVWADVKPEHLDVLGIKKPPTGRERLSVVRILHLDPGERVGAEFRLADDPFKILLTNLV